MNIQKQKWKAKPRNISNYLLIISKWLTDCHISLNGPIDFGEQGGVVAATTTPTTPKNIYTK